MAIVIRMGHQLHVHIARNIGLPMASRARHADQPEEDQAPTPPQPSVAAACDFASERQTRLPQDSRPLGLRGGRENCNAFSAGQTATHSMQLVHSTDRICSNRSTGRLDGQALLHLPQSMQACASRRILTGLKMETMPINAPYGQRNRHQKFWMKTESKSSIATTAIPAMTHLAEEVEHLDVRNDAKRGDQEVVQSLCRHADYDEEEECHQKVLQATQRDIQPVAAW